MNLREQMISSINELKTTDFSLISLFKKHKGKSGVVITETFSYEDNITELSEAKRQTRAMEVAKVMRDWIKSQPWKNDVKVKISTSGRRVKANIIDVTFMPYNPIHWSMKPEDRNDYRNSYQYDHKLGESVDKELNRKMNSILIAINNKLNAEDKSENISSDPDPIWSIDIMTEVRIDYDLNTKLKKMLDIENYWKIAPNISDAEKKQNDELMSDKYKKYFK